MGTITKRTDSKGNTAYMARVRRRGFPHLTQTFHRRTDAAAWISQQGVKIRQGLHLDDVEAKRYTRKQAIDRYSEEFECDVNRSCHLRRWGEVLGSRLLSSIDDVLIGDGLSQIKPLGGRTKNNRLAPGSVRVHLCSLSAVFKAARRWGWVKKNPVRDVERPGQGKIRVRYLDRDELRRLLAACKERVEISQKVDSGRRKSSERIDGIVTHINAMGRSATTYATAESVYARRGILVL